MPNLQFTVTITVNSRSRKPAANHLLNELQALCEGDNSVLSAEIQQEPKTPKPEKPKEQRQLLVVDDCDDPGVEYAQAFLLPEGLSLERANKDLERTMNKVCKGWDWNWDDGILALEKLGWTHVPYRIAETSW